jgi:hypothetical protein
VRLAGLLYVAQKGLDPIMLCKALILLLVVERQLLLMLLSSPTMVL